MAISSQDLPNVTGKTVLSIGIHDDPMSGHEVTIRFTDETEISVMIACQQSVSIRHFDVKTDRTIFASGEV